LNDFIVIYQGRLITSFNLSHPNRSNIRCSDDRFHTAPSRT